MQAVVQLGRQTRGERRAGPGPAARGAGGRSFSSEISGGKWVGRGAAFTCGRAILEKGGPYPQTRPGAWACRGIAGAGNGRGHGAHLYCSTQAVYCCALPVASTCLILRTSGMAGRRLGLRRPPTTPLQNPPANKLGSLSVQTPGRRRPAGPGPTSPARGRARMQPAPRSPAIEHPLCLFKQFAVPVLRAFGGGGCVLLPVARPQARPRGRRAPGPRHRARPRAPRRPAAATPCFP